MGMDKILCGRGFLGMEVGIGPQALNNPVEDPPSPNNQIQ
jgi:hypothetical protein